MNLDSLKEFIGNITTIKWIVVAFLVAVLIVDLCVFMALLGKIQEAKAQKSKVEATVSFFKDLIAKKDQLIHAEVIPQENIDALLRKVQKLAQEDNISVLIGSSLETDKQNNDKDFYVKKDIALDITGPLKNLGLFLSGLRSIPDAVLDIGEMHMTADKKDGSQVTAKINMVVLTTKDEDN